MPKRRPHASLVLEKRTRKSQDLTRGIFEELGLSDPSTRKRANRKRAVSISAIRSGKTVGK